VPSSISSSDGAGVALGALPRTSADSSDRYARQTAADRPGVAQPVPTRPIPVRPWGRILLGALLLLLLLVGGWEAYWRAFGARPGIANTYGLWAIQRRRIDAGEGNATVLLGASRLYFDVQLPVWERLAGRRPIQLSFEGTSPLSAVEDLADDPNFTGRLLIGVAPDVFFSGFEYRGNVVRYARKESPSQRVGQWLSMTFIEPYVAFYDPDFALETVLARQAWPLRTGMRRTMEVRKLAVTAADRATHLWEKVENDPEYREITREVWRLELTPSPDDPPPAELLKGAREQIARAAKVVAKLHARGVQVLFVRPPSDGPFLEAENRLFPRAQTWGALLAASGAPGIHFEDYPELRGYTLPEWSHVAYSQADRFTEALYGIVEREFWVPNARATTAGPADPAH
jgi:hypothetical protein